MTPNEEFPMTPDETRVCAAVAAMRAPSADPEFRERLKRAFVTGQLAPRIAARPAPWAQATRWALPLAAALAVVLGVSVLNRGGPWHMLDAHSAGTLAVDGRSFAMGDEAGINGALHDGAHLKFDGDGIVELGCGGQVLFQLNPGTDFILPRSAGRFWGRNTYARLSSGEVRVMTAAGFHGATLRIDTPESDVRVTGTVFSVICFPNATCVCVLRGEVAVAEHGKEPKMILAGRRRMIFNDGHLPVEDEMLPVEREKLTRFNAVEGPMLEGGRP